MLHRITEIFKELSTIAAYLAAIGVAFNQWRSSRHAKRIRKLETKAGIAPTTEAIAHNLKIHHPERKRTR